MAKEANHGSFALTNAFLDNEKFGKIENLCRNENFCGNENFSGIEKLSAKAESFSANPQCCGDGAATFWTGLI
jgi:hypothetical protein